MKTTYPNNPAPLSLPAEWDGCPHVVPCAACEATGRIRGAFGPVLCNACGGRQVRWNGVSIPEQMENAGYHAAHGACYWHWRGVLMPEVSILAAIWLLSVLGDVPPPTPAPLHLLDGQVECPRCGEPKPEREVVHQHYCRHSQGMETGTIPCEECRELMKDEEHCNGI